MTLYLLISAGLLVLALISWVPEIVLTRVMEAINPVLEKERIIFLRNKILRARKDEKVSEKEKCD